MNPSCPRFTSPFATLGTRPAQTRRSRFVATVFVIVIGMGLCQHPARAAARTWNNAGSDFNTIANWTGGVPGSNDVGLFTAAAVFQPSLSTSTIIAGLRFSNGATGFDITSIGGSILTLNGTDTTGLNGTTTASASAIRNDNASGTTTIDVPLLLAAGAGISTMYQDVADGSTLVFNSAIDQSSTVTLSLKNGTFQFNAQNSWGGGTTIDAAGTVVVIGNDNALGGGTLSINSSAGLRASGGARAIPNIVVLAADTTISGSADLTVNGSFTSSKSNSRVLTVSNSGLTTLAGNVFLSESDTLARSLTINGSGAVTISGVITNNAVGNTLASPLTYSGTNTLTLSNTNTYSGVTTLTNGKVVVSGSISGSTVAVSPGTSNTATLAVSGAGMIAPTASTGNAVTLGSGNPGSTARLAPGDIDAIGTANFTLQGTAKLTFNANSQLSFDIDGTSADRVVFSAAPAAAEWLSSTGATTLQLGGTIDYGQTYIVFENAIAIATTGAFAFQSITGYDTANYTATFAQSGNDYALSFAPIPEPASLASFTLGIGVLLGLRRRERR